MAKPGNRFELNLKGFNEIRTSPDVVEELRRRGRLIADACGEGYSIMDATSEERGRVLVFADEPEAMVREAANNNLLRNIDVARD